MKHCVGWAARGHITEESIVHPGVFFCGALKLTRSGPSCSGPRCFVAGTFHSYRRLLSSRMKWNPSYTSQKHMGQVLSHSTNPFHIFFYSTSRLLCLLYLVLISEPECPLGSVFIYPVVKLSSIFWLAILPWKNIAAVFFNVNVVCAVSLQISGEFRV